MLTSNLIKSVALAAVVIAAASSNASATGYKHGFKHGHGHVKVLKVFKFHQPAWKFKPVVQHYTAPVHYRTCGVWSYTGKYCLKWH